MAIRAVEVELVGPGTDLRPPEGGPFVQNMVFCDGAWHVRQGFGQVTQLDSTARNTSYSNDPTERKATEGYVAHLGSYLMATRFGHKQVVSVMVLAGNLSEAAGTLDVPTQTIRDRIAFGTYYAVRIYDLTTGDDWEVIAHKQTCWLRPETITPQNMRGVYATNREDNVQRWIQANHEDVYFTELNDILYFGTRTMGLHAYIPCHFSSHRTDTNIRSRDASLEGADSRVGRRGWEEPSCVVPVPAVPGLFAAEYAYLDRFELPKVTCAQAVGERLVLADNNRVYFSDAGNPAAFVESNYLDIPTEDTVVAMREMAGNLYLFTPRETWLFQPPGDSFFWDTGNLVRLSATVGCVGNNAVCRTEQGLAWCHTSGIYATGGDLALNQISAPIEPYFSRQANPPLTSFYQQDGYTALSAELAPASALYFRPERVSMVYSARLGALLCSVPTDNTILCMSGGNRWAFWQTESNVYSSGSVPTPGTLNRIKNAWLLADEDDVFAVAGLDHEILYDRSMLGGGGLPGLFPRIATTYCVLQYGRGGAADRSLGGYDPVPSTTYDTNNFAVVEDGRRDPGFWLGEVNYDPQAGEPPGFIRIGKPFEVDERCMDFPLGGAASGWQTFLVPVEAEFNLGFFQQLEIFDIRFRFDNVHWKPHCIGMSAEVDAVFTPERAWSQGGWGVGAADPDREIQIYDALGFPDPNGNEVRCRFLGPGALPAWAAQPLLNVPAQPTILFYLPFQFRHPPTAQPGDCVGMGIDIGGAVITCGSREPDDYPLGLKVWHQLTIYNWKTSRTYAQPIDWAYCSGPISVSLDERGRVGLGGANEQSHMLFRGVYAAVKARGRGTLGDEWFLTWPAFGPFNTVVSCDHRGWTSQVVDHAPAGPLGPAQGVLRNTDVRTLRPRVLSGSAWSTRTFDSLCNWASADPLINAGLNGKVLGGDEDFTLVQTSDAMRGQFFRVMHFGHLRDPAEALSLSSSKAVVRPISHRRRRVHA